MKKQYLIILSLIIAICCVTKISFAATAGNPLDLDVPQKSAVLRQEIVEQTMDECEQAVKVKASFDAEFVFNKDLHVTEELKNAELKGQWYTVKFGVTIFNKIEPYIKVGTSNLEAKWKHGGQEIEVDAKDSFAWGFGGYR